jgi:Reverse transcriptase (RNA-dependent DNA polymerase)/RNase H-like domain found in reverse transcriptase
MYPKCSCLKAGHRFSHIHVFVWGNAQFHFVVTDTDSAGAAVNGEAAARAGVMQWLQTLSTLLKGDVEPPVQVGNRECPIPVRDAANFRAGRLPEAYVAWDKVFIPESGAAPETAALVRKWLRDGVHLPDFFQPFSGLIFGVPVDAATPKPWTLANLPMESAEDVEFARTAVAELLRTGAAVAVLERPTLVLPIGVATNDAGKRRLILDGRWLNCWIPSPDMSYENLVEFRYGLNKQDVMFSVDHKSGYHHVPLTQESRQYVGFEMDGRHYTFTVLPFGISPACYIYNTMSSVMAGYFRSRCLHLVMYIDDFGFALPKRWPDWRKRLAVGFVFTSFFAAGYYVSLDKCDLGLTESLRLLGFMVDTVNQRFSVPGDKWARILALMAEVLIAGGATRNRIESLLGKLQALVLAVPCVPIFLRSWFDMLTDRAVEQPRAGEWIVATPQALNDLEALSGLKQWEPLSSWKPERHVRLETDASDHGWGAALFVDGVILLGEPFSEDELPYHIHVKETMAVEYALAHLGERIPKPCYLDVYVDNTAVQYGLLKGSSPDELARTLARSILAWQLESNVTIRMHRIGTKSNVLADTMSRLFHPDAAQVGSRLRTLAWRPSFRPIERGDHKLAPYWFAALERIVAPERFTIDICANFANCQLPRFISRDNCEFAEAVDVLAYTFPLGVQEFVYCNPPWSIIAPVWVHLRQCRVAGALLFPWVPRYGWFGMVQREAKRCFVLAPQGAMDVFFQPSLNYQRSLGPIKWPLGVALFDFSA